MTTVAFLCYVGRHRHGDGGNFVQRVSPTVVVVQNVLGVSIPHQPYIMFFFALKVPEQDLVLVTLISTELILMDRATRRDIIP